MSGWKLYLVAVQSCQGDESPKSMNTEKNTISISDISEPHLEKQTTLESLI